MNRRIFLKSAATCILTSLIVAGKARAQQSVQIVWVVPRGQLPTVRETLDFNGKVTDDPASPRGAKGLPLLLIFVGVAGLSSLATALASVYRDVRYGGVVVAAHDGKLEISNDPRLGGGTLIVYGDGVQVYQSKQDTGVDAGELLKALTSVTTKKPAR